LRECCNILGFLVVLAIFTVVKFIAAPLMLKLSLQHMRELSGGVALVTTFVGLFLTTLFTDGLEITGLSTWVIATLTVWLFGVLAAIVLPMFLFKSTVQSKRPQFLECLITSEPNMIRAVRSPRWMDDS
jgi:putative membrane protein